MADLLIIDDDLECRNSVKNIVEESEYNYLSIYESETAHRGLTLLNQNQPAILLIDLSLPDKSGFNVGEKAIELYPQLPVIVLTHLKMFNTVQSSINAGFSGYLLKPFSKSELLKIFDVQLKYCTYQNPGELLENKQSNQDFITDYGNPIKTATRFIQSNYKETINLKDVSDLVYLSPSHFSRLFKEETGTTFIEYLINYRIEKSKDMLKVTSLPIEVIANNIGFTTASYFATTFKRIVSKTPREYRSIFTHIQQKI